MPDWNGWRSARHLATRPSFTNFGIAHPQLLTGPLGCAAQLNGRVMTGEESGSLARRWGEPSLDLCEPGDDPATIATGVRRARWREKQIRLLEVQKVTRAASAYALSTGSDLNRRAATEATDALGRLATRTRSLQLLERVVTIHG